ncbi:hypothetical protein C8J56DRAFT_897347 [Mycena floridula]|nr:hypothetical protein C8J56DRAFT_897347 [Mycena floridula]
MSPLQPHPLDSDIEVFSTTVTPKIKAEQPPHDKGQTQSRTNSKKRQVASENEVIELSDDDPQRRGSAKATGKALQRKSVMSDPAYEDLSDMENDAPDSEPSQPSSPPPILHQFGSEPLEETAVNLVQVDAQLAPVYQEEQMVAMNRFEAQYGVVDNVELASLWANNSKAEQARLEREAIDMLEAQYRMCGFELEIPIPHAPPYPISGDIPMQPDATRRIAQEGMDLVGTPESPGVWEEKMGWEDKGDEEKEGSDAFQYELFCLQYYRLYPASAGAGQPRQECLIRKRDGFDRKGCASVEEVPDEGISQEFLSMRVTCAHPLPG